MGPNIYDLLQAQRLTTSTKVNQELSRVISLMLRDFISTWYATLTADKDLYSEMIQTIAQLLQELERRLIRVEWVGLLTHDLPKVLKSHIQDYKVCCAKVGTSYAGGQSFEELFFGMQPHVALQSSENEKEYMRRVSEIVVDALIPEHELQSDGVRLLLRELVCNNVLLMLVEVLSEPDFINEMVLKVLVPEIVLDSPQSDFSRDEASDLSEVPFSDTENTDSNMLSIPTVKPQPQPMISDSTLFRVKNEKEKSFLRRRRQKSDPLAHNAFTQGLNKLTFGGLERVSSGFDKLKDLVIHSPNESMSLDRRKKKDRRKAEGLFVPNSESEADLESPSIVSGSSAPVALPYVKVEDETKSETQFASRSERMELPRAPAIIVTESGEPKKHSEPISNVARSAFGLVWRLHWESRNGPWKLGPINTSLYERFHLEENVLELLEELLEFQNHHRWIYVQLQFFIKPIMYAVGGHVINRAILRGIHTIISEESIANYCALFRESFWPNDQPCPVEPTRTESEKARIRQMLEDAIQSKIKSTFI
jgi:hypothetical protein